MALASTPDVSLDVVRRALPQMSKFGIPITPPNYAVWYEYLNERNVELKREMDALVDQERITSACIEELYDRYIKNSEGQDSRHSEQLLRAMMLAFRDQMEVADGELCQYGESLEAFSGHLAHETSSEGLQQFIGEVLRETGAVMESSNSLRQRFEEVSSEVQTLQEQLETVRAEAATDHLTGISNRKAFDEMLERMARESLENGTHAPCLVMLDIDHFKKFNDSYGHLVGDRVIQHIATMLKKSVKGKDMVARFGGEEFAVLLADAPMSGCIAVAEQIRESIAAEKLHVPDLNEPIGPVTVSAGVAWFREGERFEDFVGRADKFLYQSKQAGRNRVSVDR